MIKKYIFVLISLLIIGCSDEENNRISDCELTAFLPVPECVTDSFVEVTPPNMPEETNTAIGCDCSGDTSGDFYITFDNPSFLNVFDENFGTVRESRQSATLFQFTWEIEDCTALLVADGFNGILDNMTVPEEGVLEFVKNVDGESEEDITCTCTQFLFCLDG